MLVSKPTHGGGAPLGIDLDGGVAKIRIKAKPAPAEPVEPTGPDPATGSASDPDSPDAVTPADETPERA